MRRHAWSATLLIVLATTLAHAQTAVRGVMPGKSDAAAVAKALGPPVRNLSATLAEHASGDPGAKLFVQYRDGIVERIDIAYPAGRDRATVLSAAGIPRERPYRGAGVLGRSEESFDRTAIVLTHRGDENSPIISAAFYSRERYSTLYPREPSTPPPRIEEDVDGGVDDRLVGCFKDTSAFDLDGFLERSPHNTPERCITTCTQKGFAYAGVQYGESCLCGNSYGRYGPATNCDYHCTGDANAICGGYSANTIYRTGHK